MNDLTHSFTIIRGLPMPSPDGRGRLPMYPFAKMEVGDAFDAPRDLGVVIKRGKVKWDKRASQVSSAATNYGRKYGAKFSIRCIDEQTVRCWRVA